MAIERTVVDRMDVYSDMQVPFHVSAFCRGRRFMPSVVSLGNALRAKETAQRELRLAQDRLDATEREVAGQVVALQARMQQLGETGDV